MYTLARRRVISNCKDSPETAFLAALAAYFLLHLLIRINLPGSLGRDEAEIVYLAQQLRLGYGAQPPLYAWLQRLMFSLFGLNLFSISLLKNLLLLATYVCVLGAGRQLLGPRRATAAALSLCLFPQIVWESQRDLTHSVLLTVLAAATLWCYFAMLRKPDVLRHALFGVLIGLGMETKYNFGIFVAGLACASLLVKQHRQILWNRKLAVTAALALLVVLPHALWLLDHLQAATSGTLHKMAEGTADAGYFGNVGTGLASLMKAALAFSAPALVVFALLRRRHRQVAFDWRSPDSRFFLCLYGSFLALLVAIVLTGEVGKIKDRWMLPLLFSLPLAFFVLLPLPEQDVLKRIVRLAAVIGVAVLLLLPARVLLGPKLGRQVPSHLPYPQLSAELGRRFPQLTNVVAEDTLLAGNLRFYNHAMRTVLLSWALTGKENLDREVLLVMNEDAEPGWLQRFRAAYPRTEVRAQGRITLQQGFGSRKTVSFDYAHIAIKE